MVLVLNRQETNKLSFLFDRQKNLYKQLQDEIVNYLEYEHAKIFAQPEYYNNIVRWNAEGQHSLAWKELDQKQQQLLLDAARSILSDIELVTHQYPYSVLAKFFDQCRQFPSLDYLYAVDGKPVITAWGCAGENGTYDLLAGSSIKNNKYIILWSYFPWLTALVAITLGLIVSIFVAHRNFANKTCIGMYPSHSQIQRVLDNKSRNDQLIIKRNKLLDEWNILQKQCQIPTIKPLIPLDPPKLDPLQSPEQLPKLPFVVENQDLPDLDNLEKKNVPKPSPPKVNNEFPKNQGDLPKESWNKKDTRMLNGCWHLTTQLELFSHGLFFTSHQPVTNWELCFSPNGAGQQTLTRQDGGTCRGPLYAGFHGDQLILNQPNDCQGDFHLITGKNVCIRLNDREARCNYIDVEGHQSTGIFKR